MQFGEEFLLDFTFLGGLFQVSRGVTARIPSPDILRWRPNIHIDCPCPHTSSVDLSEKSEDGWPNHCGETGCLMWEKISRTKISDSKRHHHSFHGFSLFDASILKLKTFLQEKRKKNKNNTKNICWTSGPCKTKKKLFFLSFTIGNSERTKRLEKFIISSQLEAPPEPSRGCLTQVTLGISPPQSWRNSARHTAVQRIEKCAPWRTLLSGYWPDKACAKES